MLRERVYLRQELQYLLGDFATQVITFGILGSVDLDRSTLIPTFTRILVWHLHTIMSTFASLWLPCHLTLSKAFAVRNAPIVDSPKSEYRHSRTSSVTIRVACPSASVRMKRLEKVKSSGSESTGNMLYLQRVLDNPKWRQAFLDFLVREVAAESLFFLDHATEFEVKFSSSDSSKIDMIEHANAIYDKFIDTSSPLAVNLSAQRRYELAAAIKKITTPDSPKQELHIFPRPSGGGEGDGNTSGEIKSDKRNSATSAIGRMPLNYLVFEKASAEVFKMLANDSFRRYKQTKEYAEIEKQVEIAV
eukprot:TRINITY_DN8497_c0_g1_i1.p1 TRINITY_DN8497_c0_g1~~TRINITY_DN8497_c0_g1_i1.p1  ORF type:complete len:304 (+),score=53.84 TRINITY_DN8497_c0_g1_i1:965-1876(+)